MSSLSRRSGGKLARAGWLLGAFALTLGSCRLRPSSVPLGGVHVDESELEAPSRDPDLTAKALPSVEPGTEPSPAEPAATETAPPTSAPDAGASSSVSPSAPAPPGTGAFEPKPYALNQAWTRVFDLELDLKVGPGGNLDMKMETHQEARFEVLGVTNGALDKLGIEYVVYTSKVTLMGATQDSPEELAGKRFVITFVRDKPQVRDASGATPPKKQVDSVQDDAREPLETEKGLKELARLVTQNKGGRADFSRAGAVALAGGEDDDTKVPAAKASLVRLGAGSALIDLAYTLTNELDDKSTIEVQVAGNLTVLDAPGRFASSTLQGPMELRAADPSGMQGRGTIKVTTTYKY